MTTESVPLNKLAVEVAPLDTAAIGSSVGNRIMAFTVLAAVLTGGGFLAVTTVRAVTDAWVAPLELSPDHDGVIQLRLNHARQQSELARAEGEIRRVEGDIAAIGGAIERLSALRGVGKQSIAWQAGASDDEARQLATTLAHLTEQRAVLTRLHDRQRGLTERARQELQAGLVERTEVERQEQALDGLSVSLLENQRELDAATFRQQQVAREGSSFRSAFRSNSRSRNPGVAATEEHAVRIEVELLRLESERRGLETLRQVALENVERQRTLLDEIRHRPLFRAMTEKMNVVFVPYSQLADVAAGHRVLDCTFGLLNCRDVGAVSEVLPGEVATQDPWGNPARGRYAVLSLDAPDAIREKLLRLRPA